jgi:COP9 signalosome complex subunit 1
MCLLSRFIVLTISQLLTSVPSSSRAALHNEVLKTAKEYEREARRRIQHMNIVAADIEIKGNKNRSHLGAMDEFFADSIGSGRELRSGRGFS